MQSSGNFQTTDASEAEIEAAIEAAVSELGTDAGVEQITDAVERILQRSRSRASRQPPASTSGSSGNKRASRSGSSTSPSTTTIPQPAAGVINRSRSPNSPNTARRGNTTSSSKATASGSPQISYLSPSTSRGNRFSHEPRGDYAPASGSAQPASCNRLILTAAGDITGQRKRELVEYLESQQCRVTEAETSREGSTGTVIARVDVCECPLPLAELKRHLEDLGVRMGIMVGLQTEELFNYIHRL